MEKVELVAMDIRDNMVMVDSSDIVIMLGKMNLLATISPIFTQLAQLAPIDLYWSQ
jgi:hypothetical protein